MTSLQATALGGGDTTAKTSSYVLVAADAGTTVAMNAAGATTITVNTGLFAAGDTVFIQNLGAGACTVTAGTATVATAGSLILPQNDAGILYFTATGAAIFYDYIQAGAVSPLTTKGDLYTFSTSDARLGVGANGTTLVADSSEATGLKWQAAAAASYKGVSLYATPDSQSLTNNTLTALTFNEELYDTDAFHNNVTNNTRITIPAGLGGKYLVNGTVIYNTNGTGSRLAQLHKNGASVNDGADVIGNASTYVGNTFSCVVSLVATDYLELIVRQTSGGALDCYKSQSKLAFTATYLGA